MHFSRKILKIYSQNRNNLKFPSKNDLDLSDGFAEGERLFRRDQEETMIPIARKISSEDSAKNFDVLGKLVQLPSYHIEEPGYVKGLGEGGEKVEFLGDEAELAEQIIKTEAFNRIASDKISVHRSVPDTRDPQCRELQYDYDLPTTSVIIIFTNEAWTPLLRTIWSILDRTPDRYLHEIILVDDFSDSSHLQQQLDEYIIDNFPNKVKLKRLKSRQGLIRARLEGAKLASGDVILFLDSHCECGDKWLEPLVQRIKDNRKTFVVPVIDVIDDKTMEYYHSNGNYFQIGGFTWSGHFNWVDVPENDPVQYNKTLPTKKVRQWLEDCLLLIENIFGSLGHMILRWRFGEGRI
ncbi:GALNT [Lepeophtheirus salmonis]|uniref:GALNT n=1 Tax=Lepeophtheirus salmonis TaxID=72036 RepID=A0A7R8CGG4_LEPSM|nr:GALNT [Lepeophtheirus salmonis]CAF2809718.1 GALNT [Lepeophtheirus salmonis]